VDYAAIIGGIVSLGMIVLAKPLVHLVFGDNYSASVIVLQVFALSPVMIFYNRICGTMLLVLGMQGKALNTVLMSCLLLNIGLNLILIPTFGYIGGAVAALAVQLLALILNLWFINRKLQTKTYPTNVAVLFPVLFLSLFAQLYLPGTVLKIIVPLCMVGSSALLFCRYDRGELLALASRILRRT
jgi:O-antigen/teichoic acid export membrane protein